MPDGAQRPVGFADTYHGKVVTLAAATQLVTLKQDLNLGDLEHIVPYANGARHRAAEPRPYRRHDVPLPRCCAHNRACPWMCAWSSANRLPGSSASTRPTGRVDQLGRGGRDLDRRT